MFTWWLDAVQHGWLDHCYTFEIPSRYATTFMQICLILDFCKSIIYADKLTRFYGSSRPFYRRPKPLQQILENMVSVRLFWDAKKAPETRRFTSDTSIGLL